MKTCHRKSLVVISLFAGLCAHSLAGNWPDGAPAAQKIFACAKEGALQPQFLAWTDSGQQLVAVSALREDSQVPPETKGMQHASSQGDFGVRMVKAGYLIVSADQQNNGTLVVSGARYGCIPSYDD